MPNDPPIHTDQRQPRIQTSGFKERLLQVGENSPDPGECGVGGFKLIEQLFPVQFQVFNRSIGELADRLTEAGSTTDQTTQSTLEARRLLGLTLIPFIDVYLTGTATHDENNEFEAFRQLAAPWASSQLKSCVRYITGLAVHDYGRHITGGVVEKGEQERLRELAQVIDEHGHRPEAVELVERARREMRQLSATLASRPMADPINPRALSYLLTCTTDGELRDIALAAVILKGNSSPGQEAVVNPLQILEVADVAAITGLNRNSVTSNVSKIRSKAAKGDRIDRTPYELDPRQLWVYVEPAEAGRKDPVVAGKEAQ